MTNTINENDELDNYSRLTDPMPDDVTKYSFKAINKYCKENGKELSELTQDEIDKFKKD